MKKLLLVSISALLMSASCADEEPAYEGLWYVKNGTTQTLVLAYPFFAHYVVDHMSYERTITSGDSLLVNNSAFRLKDDVAPYFNRWLEKASIKYGDTLMLKIASEDNVLLKEWRYLDRNQSGKQFFKESSWHHYDTFIEENEQETTTDIWTFTMLPEDIAQE